MAIQKNYPFDDPAASRRRAEETLIARFTERFRAVIASPDGCGEVTVFIKNRSAVRITTTNSELIAQ